MFGVNMTFISSSEVKKCIFHECRRRDANLAFARGSLTRSFVPWR